MGFPRASGFAPGRARRLVDAASKSPPREPSLRIAKRQGVRSGGATRAGHPGRGFAPRAGRDSPVARARQARSGRSAVPGDAVSRKREVRLRIASERTWDAICGAAMAPLLRSKKFRYSGRLGGRRSALEKLLGQHRSQGFRVIDDAENARTGVGWGTRLRGVAGVAAESSGNPCRRTPGCGAGAIGVDIATWSYNHRGILRGGSRGLRFSR